MDELKIEYKKCGKLPSVTRSIRSLLASHLYCFMRNVIDKKIPDYIALPILGAVTGTLLFIIPVIGPILSYL